MTTPKLKRQARALALATAMLGGFAATSLAEDARTVPEETKAAITQKLQSEGYEVRKIKREDGMVVSGVHAPLSFRLRGVAMG